MPRPSHCLVRLILTSLFLGLALEAVAAVRQDELQRLKRLQQQILLREPAERLEKLERFRAWRKKAGRKSGYRLRSRPPRGPGDLAAVRRPDFFARSRSSALESVSAPPNVLANDPTGEPAGSCQSEVSIAALGDNVVAAWNDGIGVYGPPFPEDTQGFAYSTDGGLTWTDGGVPPTTNIGLWVSDPVVTVNEKTGAFYFSALTDQPTAGTNGIGVVKGTFSGNTFAWGAPVLARVESNSVALLDKEWMVADSLNGNLYLTYSHFTISGGQFTSDFIGFARSTDDGQTWTDVQTLSAPIDAGYVQGSRPAVGPNGEVYVVWHAIGQPANSAFGRDFLRIRRSLNAGVSFASEVTADSVFSNFGTGAPGFNRGLGITFPGIAVDRSRGPNRGRVYVTWNECVNFYADAGSFPDPRVPGTGTSETESNNGPADADAFQPGVVLRGTIALPNDLDYWRWNATQGQTYILYLDSLDTNLDASFRVFCSDGTTNLAFSQNGIGGEDLVVFTAPTTATYYLRVASYAQGRTGRYVILTTAHQPRGDDRARDQRDIFVKSSSNGIVWGPTVRVNDSPGHFDDWLPEVAVDGSGRVFAACYDWRDAAGICGGGSNAYLYRSGDAGATWIGGTRISDSTTDWTATYSTLIPNQGDYIGLHARDSTVFVAWGDGRGASGDPDVYVAKTKLDCTEAPVQEPPATQVTADTVVVTWGAPDGTPATVFRREGSGVYVSLGPIVAGPTNEIVYVDATVAAGQTYSYRLEVTGFCEQFVGEVTVTVPAPGGPALAIVALGPNPLDPTRPNLYVRFSLESSAPATFALYDISGREVLRTEVGSTGPGTFEIMNLTQGTQLKAGLYFVRLSQGGRSKEKRVSVFP